MWMRMLCCLALALAHDVAQAGSGSILRSGFEAGEIAPPPPPPPPPPAAASGGLGTNLESVEDFSSVYPFTDFFRQSRPWITSSQTVFDTGDADQLDLDDDGWVRSLPACTADPQQFCFARTVINSAESDYPNGTWLVLYEGSGTLTYSGSAVLLTSAPGRDTIAVASDGIVIITLEATAPAPGHLRNLRVYPPGFDPAVAPVPTFHPDFLAELAPYRTLRFMDWMRTNGGGFSGEPNTQEEFADRALPSDAHFTREAGVPLELMIELANTSGTEPWFTLPHRASDAYVEAFAAMVLAGLAPQRRVYVEYSNEVWNPAFPQGTEIEARGNALYGSLGDPFIRRLTMHGQRTAEVCARFKAVFAAQAARVTCVLGAQAANAFTQTEAADCPIAIQAGQRTSACHTDIDAVAIAPYFGNYTNLPVNEDEVGLWSLDDLFAELTSGGQLQDVFPDVATPCTENFPPIPTQPCPVAALEEVQPWTRAHRDAATARDLSLYAYEGGQHLVGVFGVENNDAITALFTGANRDPRMEEIYESYLAQWETNGGELFVNFALSFPYGRFGSWGVLESLGQDPRPPKANAIDDFNALNPCWWDDCGVDGEVPPPPPPPPPPPACPSQLLIDPGLEATDFSDPGAPSHPAWASTSSNFGSVLCSVGTCPDDGGTAVPRSGQAWAWFGGIAASETASLQQTLVIPAGGARHLNFFLRRSRSTAPFDARLRVLVDGITQRDFDEPAVAESEYVARSVDLSAFADGSSHTIRLEYANAAGSGTSNFVVDDLTLDCTPSGS